MIERNTVLIVGAGGSAPYGFPTDVHLRREILDKLGDESSDVYHLLTTDDYFSSADLENFRRRLQRADTETIDQFLVNQQHWSELGKVAIAAVLARYEVRDRLHADADHWYQYLLSRLVDDCSFDDLGRNQLSILTYNYDRSLEEYLHMGLLNRYHQATSVRVAQVFQRIVIVHLHGGLCRLPWQASANVREYQPDVMFHEVQQAASMIQAVHEAGPGPAFEDAHRLIANAEKIIFVGFGYHEGNLRRLRGSLQAARNADIVGTGYGVSPRQRRRIAQEWGVRVHEDSTCQSRQFLEQSGLLT